MRSAKKVLGMAMVSLFAFVPFLNVSAQTEWTLKDWETENGDYGSVTAVDDNITNIKGSDTATEGMFLGPYSMKSEAKLADGITEDVYIELNKDSMANGELFGLTMSLNDASDSYVTELLVDTQKVNDGYLVTVGLDPDFSYTISEDGVYTYRYTATLEDGKTYLQFSILKWDEVIASTTKIDMGETTAVSAGYMWFCSITAANGINVYTTLPEKPSEEIPVEPVEPTEPSEEVTTPDSESTIEEQNPETSDSIILTVGMLVTSLTLVGFGIKALKKRA